MLMLVLALVTKSIPLIVLMALMALMVVLVLVVLVVMMLVFDDSNGLRV